MKARFFKCGDPPPTYGGDFERHVLRELTERLPSCYLVIGNPSLPTARTGFFYEYDAIVMSPFSCDVLEAKRLDQICVVH